MIFLPTISFPLFFLLISLFQLTPATRAEGVVAIVNKDIITISQVRGVTQEKERELQTRLKFGELERKVKELRLAALNDLIDRQLILQEFQSKGYEIPVTLLDERISTIIKEEFEGDSQAFQRSLEAQNYSLDSFKAREREKIAVEEMKRSATEGIVSVPEAEIADDYRTHLDQYSSAGRTRQLEDVHDAIKSILLRNERESVMKAWVRRLREPAYIHILWGHPEL